MKKYVYFLFFIGLCLSFLSGCESFSDNNTAEEIENKKNDLIQSAEINDLEPTIYEHINDFAGVTMIVKKGTLSPTGMIVILENNSGKQCIYGEFFVLEKKIHEEWYQVPVSIDGDYGFEDIGYDLSPGDSGEWKVDWNWLYGSLDSGEYRIIKDILDFRSTGDFDKHYLVVEFTI